MLLLLQIIICNTTAAQALCAWPAQADSMTLAPYLAINRKIDLQAEVDVAKMELGVN